QVEDEIEQPGSGDALDQLRDARADARDRARLGEERKENRGPHRGDDRTSALTQKSSPTLPLREDRNLRNAVRQISGRGVCHRATPLPERFRCAQSFDPPSRGRWISGAPI